MDQDQIESMQQPAQHRHQQEHNLQDERHQARRIPQQWHQPEQNLQEERLHNQAQARQAPPEAQRPPTQRPQNVVFNPEVDIGFISHNLRRIGEEHPERQQLIINVMRAYLEVFNSNLPANTTPEDVYEYLTREYPNETGEQL
ncbi:Protein CBG26706 [Caenorhabditis briggsae]|nr:Protein CBG26706 [Caenorhabditis briggsae]CAS01139.1 Protein CBG26706 [Caenorhabditis briggsae]